MKRIILCLITFLIISSPSYAYDKSDLKKVEQEIFAHKKKSSEIYKQVKNNEKELKSIQNKSIKIANSLQNNTKKINDIKEELVDLNASIKIKEMQLANNSEKSAAVLSSLIRISSIPTDGFVVASDNPQELINTRILLNSALPNLEEKANSLQKEIETIEDTKLSISSKSDKLKDLNKTTKEEMKEIESLLKKKKALKSKLTASQKKEQAELKKLAKQASSMKDFLKKLQSRKVKAKPRSKPNQKAVVAPKSKPAVKFTGAKGNMPIAGKITLSYGKKNPQNLTNYGWEMRGNANGLVTCPIAGEVLFSGQFGSYDQMLVFDNGSGYNLILAGMGKVGVEVGDKVQSGEPVGFLKSSPADLYVELRKNGNPVNPVKVIK